MNKIKVFIFILIILPPLAFAQNQENSRPKAGLTPESRFYFLDKFSERVQEFFAFSPAAKVRLQVSLAAERTAEINELLGIKGVDSEVITTVRIRLEEHNNKISTIIDKEIKKEKKVDTLYIERDRIRELTNRTINLIERLKLEKRMTEEEQKQHINQEHINQKSTRDNHAIPLSPTPQPSKSPIPIFSSRLPIPSPKQTPAPNQIVSHPNAPISTITPNSSSLKSQFLAIEQELTAAKNSKSVLSMTHYERINKDLNSLKSQGYAASEVDRLQKLAIELTPEITDQNKPASTTPTQEPCVNSRPQLIADFTNFSKIQKITAPGSSSSEGPKGHAFIWTNSQRVPIYAPIDAILESGAYSRDKEDSPNQYNLTFDIKGSCFKFRFDHIDEPIDSIRFALPSTPKVADSRGTAVTKVIEFKAGDLIGYTKGNLPSGNWDFGLYDMSKEGALAQYGSYGLHRHSVCWPDYYSTDKYKKLLEGPKLVCFQSSSASLPSPPTSTSVNKNPVLKNLGVSFEPWDKNTNRAGAFIFLPAENKLFLEYGVEVASSEGGTKILPTFEYRTARDADVFAAMDGIVTNITYKERTKDYSILIQPELNSEWTLGHDHVNNLKVSQGDAVKAGNILGKAGTLGEELGRTEIMFWGPGLSSTRVNTYCPFKYFAPELLSEYQQKVLRHMKDWEEFKGNPNLYNEEKHPYPGCVYETILD